MKILVVDDQRSARRLLRHMLGALDGVETLEASSLVEARAAVVAEAPDLLLVDLRLSDDPMDRGGLELLRWLRATGYATPAVMVTAFGEASLIREAMRRGAHDYVFKDELCPEMLLPIVQGILEKLRLSSEVTRLRSRLSARYGTRAIVGSSPGIERVRQIIERVAGSDCTVLIRGKTGSGKELVARTLHQTSPRAEEPFLAVNCSALPGALVESLIFGHEKGAFTGADRRVRGQLELAGAGTVLLDEIAEMPPEVQAKLLRVLEDRRFRPLGFERELPLRARVLASTHVDLAERIRQGRFREDLFYRLEVVTIDVPSLAERKGDLPELLTTMSTELLRPLSFTEAAIAWLSNRSWPGNVRELRNALQRVALLSDEDRVDANTLRELVGDNGAQDDALVDRLARSILTLSPAVGSKMDRVERAVLAHALQLCGGKKAAAARLIGIGRKSFERRWERLANGIPDEEED